VIADDVILEAEGVVKLVEYDEKPWWIIVIDPATMRDIAYVAPTATSPA
jgi:hypothetical protein